MNGNWRHGRGALALVGAVVMIGATAAPAGAQRGGRGSGSAERPWDVTLARGKTRDIDFTTTEGTRMAVDISPDGSWIVFDLLGQIYRLPATGGDATCLTQNSGVAINYQPRISPDGKTIAFISDRRGQNNLWLMNIDGSDPRPVELDLTSRAVEPDWTPDGRFIVVRKEPMGPGGAGGPGGLWMYSRDGGQGVAVVPAAGRDGPEWPSVSHDGRYLYYYVHMATVTDNEPLSGYQQLRRVDLKTGETLDVTAGESVGAAASRNSSGGGAAPEISPDGRWLAFAREIPDGTISYKGHEYGPRTSLWLRDMKTGAERMIMDPIEAESSGEGYSLGVLPLYHWAADGRSIVITEGGKLRRVDVTTGAVSTIPFSAKVHRTISEMARHTFRITDDPFQVKFARWQTASPDGRQVAFQAVGRVYVASVSGGEARRLTPASFNPLEYSPSWSPDGQWIVFVTWDETERGQVWKVPAAGGTPTLLSADPGDFIDPVWAPDGGSVIVTRGDGATARGRTITANAWFDVVRLSAAGGDTGVAITTITRPSGSSLSGEARRQLPRASFGPDGRIFFPEEHAAEGGAAAGGRGRGSDVELVSVNADGGDRQVHASFPSADEIVPSPDGSWLAFQEGDNVYVTPFAWQGIGGKALSVNKRRGEFPVTQLSNDGGDFPRWRDRNTVEFGNAATYFAHHMDTGVTDTVALTVTVPQVIPQGSVALTNARILTMDHRKVVERGTIVIKGARITCVGSCSTSGVDRVIDAAGKTIMPGIVDMHAHEHREWRGMRPRHDYEESIYLAYGVTTNLDPSMWSQNLFPTAELIRAGQAYGPRTFSTGDPLTNGDGPRANELTSYTVAYQNVQRLADWGATAMKQYREPRRDQRQWVSEAARHIGVNVTAEGGDLDYDLGMIMDGQTGWEHPIADVPLYSDATTFFGMAHATYSPTLVVGGPAAWNIEYFYQSSDVWKDPKQRLWFPWRTLIPHTRIRTLRPATDYSYPLIAQGVADVIAAGGNAAVGGHGEHHGLNVHWEIWMGASAFGNMGALEVATIDGAKFLGADQDIGSLEVGKLADLIVLNSNPLDNIRNTVDAKYVMKGGILYNAMTLDEVWPKVVPYGPHYWLNADELQMNNKALDSYDKSGGHR